MRIGRSALRGERRGDVLIARAYGRPGAPSAGFADAVSASTYAQINKMPILLTPQEELPPVSSGTWGSARPRATASPTR